MKKILLGLFIFITVTVSGQNHLVGVKTGCNWSNTVNSNFGKTNFKPGFSGGLTYDYLFKSYFSTGADILFENRGFKDMVIFTDQNGSPLAETTFKYNYNYISIPLKIGFHYGKKFYGFANLAVLPSLLINSNVISPVVDIHGRVGEDQKINVTKSVSKFNIGALAEIGGGYKFKERYWLFLSFQYQHHFLSVTNSGYFRFSKIYPYAMVLNLGFQYALTK